MSGVPSIEIGKKDTFLQLLSVISVQKQELIKVSAELLIPEQTNLSHWVQFQLHLTLCTPAFPPQLFRPNVASNGFPRIPSRLRFRAGVLL